MGDKTIILGDMSFATSNFPHDIVRLYDKTTGNSIPILSVNVVNGHLAVSATITSEDGRLISQLKDNNWIVNPNNILSKENDDLSSLKILDQMGKTALDIRFANPKVIVIKSITFRYNHTIIEGNKDGIYIDGHRRISNICIESSNPRAKGLPIGAFIGIPVN